MAIAAATEGLDPVKDKTLAVALYGPGLDSIYIKGGDGSRTAGLTRIPQALYLHAGQDPDKAVDRIKAGLEARHADLLLAYNSRFVGGFIQGLMVRGGRPDLPLPQYLDMLVVARAILNGQFYMYPVMTLQEFIKKLQQGPYDRKMKYRLMDVMQAFGLEDGGWDRPAHEKAAMDIWRLYGHLAGLECLRLM